MSVRRAAVLGLCTLSAACTATETGNPVAPQRLALTARSSAADVTVGTAAEGGVSVSEAWVVLGDIRFVQSANCDGGAEVEADIPGPTVVELVAGAEVIDFAVEETSYCRVRVQLERAQQSAAGAPALLEDHAIAIRGTGRAGTPFVIRSRQTTEADIRSRDEPFSLAQADSSLILAFDVARWLEGLDLDAAEPQDDGVVWIDGELERNRLDRFEANVEAAMELFRDLDDDQQLDDREALSPLASGG